ncbi:zinc finger protein 596-like [Stegodyphus dumicola]|uniref:zinc finger protein 596-like n=1 Tax=Stegodyphus dumicola TaxID=202533 RepID=UPI0015B31CE9|nr:zinc finger protein 596-like [Stegodyphus dumicola]
MCPKSFPKKWRLLRHLHSHRNDKPNVYESILEKSSGKKFHECAVCFKSSAYPSLLQQHVHIPTAEKPHDCNLCVKSFALQSSLRRDMHEHEVGKKHTCNICDKSFPYTW